MRGRERMIGRRRERGGNLGRAGDGREQEPGKNDLTHLLSQIPGYATGLI